MVTNDSLTAWIIVGAPQIDLRASSLPLSVHLASCHLANLSEALLLFMFVVGSGGNQTLSSPLFIQISWEIINRDGDAIISFIIDKLDCRTAIGL